MKRAIMYGGGNIGRGFIGLLMSQSGYHVDFIDVAPSVVGELHERGYYHVRYVGNDGFEDVVVSNVDAIDGNDTDAVVNAIADADVMATAVGARILKYIVPNIVAGIRKRWSVCDRPLNILICENLNNANLIVEKMIKENLTTEECVRFDESVGLVEASIGRMVPVQTEDMKAGEPLRVCVERYCHLPVDKAAFKGEMPEINGMVPFEPFDFFIKRKLFIHNMGHAVTAYLGGLKGYKYIYQAVADPEIRLVTQNAMTESAVAISKRYGHPLPQLLDHIWDLLSRFDNAALKDTCARVGGDPSRKLGPDDRLIGSSMLVLEEGAVPAYVALGAAAGVKRLLDESDAYAQNIDDASRVLSQVCGLQPESPLWSLILMYYAGISRGMSLAELRGEADMKKALSTGGPV